MTSPYERSGRATENVSRILNATVPAFTLDEVAPENLEFLQYGFSSRGQPNMPINAQLGDADIFTVNGRPDLIVRANDDNEFSLSAMIDIDEALNDARKAGVPVIPYKYFEKEDGNIRFVVPRLSGVVLNEALKIPTPDLIAEVDDVWTALSDYFEAQDAQGKSYAKDIKGPQQYMFASMPGSKVPHIWMPDIGRYTDKKGGKYYDEFYLEELAGLAASIVTIESSSRQQLPRARANLIRVVDGSKADSKYLRGIKRVAKHMLEQNVVIDVSEDDSIPDEFYY